ncbi:MAG: hypothetical protein ACQESG_05860 [Nanobdellota archaeon]
MKLPKVPKKISAYLMGEDGKISKQSIMALGSFLGSAALGSLLSESVAAKPKVCTWCYGQQTTVSDDNPSAEGQQNPVESKYCHENNLSDFEYNDATYQVKVTHSHDVQHCSY